MEKKNYIIISSVVLLIVTIGIISFVWVTTSLWFMWELLPSDKHSAIALHNKESLAYYIDEYDLTSWGLSYYPLVSRLAFNQEATGEILVMLPKLKHQFKLKDQLEENGWRVERLGLLLRAQKGQVGNSSAQITEISNRFIARIFDSNLPMNPLFIIDIKKEANPYIGKDVFGFAYTHSDIIDMQFLFDGAELPDNSQDENLEHNEIGSGSLSLRVPSNSINFLSDERKIEINNLLAKRTGFIHTKPNIVNILTENEVTLIDITGNSTSVGIEGDSQDFIKDMMSFISKEETYTRPVIKAFRLPDGSLGYEKVPGEERDLFNEDGSCIETIGVEVSLWLCLSNNRSFVSTDKSEGMETLNEDYNSPWVVQLGKDYVDMLNLKNVKYLEASGTDQFVNVRMVTE